jgi:hypothetical protein
MFVLYGSVVICFDSRPIKKIIAEPLNSSMFMLTNRRSWTQIQKASRLPVCKGAPNAGGVPLVRRDRPC